MTHPVYVDGVAPQKANARVYTPIVLGNTDALRALSIPNVQLVYIKALRALFDKDTSDTTSSDNGATVIRDFDNSVWKIVDGAGVGIDAAGLLAGRTAFDAEDPGFTYFATDTALLYVRLNAGGWSDGTSLTGPAGAPGAPGSALLTATSVSSIALEAGSKVFTLEEEEERGYAIGSYVLAVDAGNPTTNYGVGRVTAYTHPSLTLLFSVDDIVGSGTIADWILSLTARRGAAGVQPGVLYDFDTVTTEGADAGTVRADNADLSAATELYLSDDDAAGIDHAAFLAQTGDSTSSSNKGQVALKRVSNGQQTIFNITAAAEDETGYTILTVAYVSGPTSIPDEAEISVEFDQRGDAGSGAASFTALDDTPANYSGAALKRVRVNSGATALEFVEPGAEISGATGKTTPHNDDVVGISDSEASGVFKKLSWANIKTALASVFVSLAGAALTGGFTATTDDDGTPTTTYKPTPSGGNFKKIVCDGALEIQAPDAAGDYTITVKITNNGSAGNKTFSGFTKAPSTASFTNTNGHIFLVRITKIDGTVLASVEAAQ